MFENTFLTIFLKQQMAGTSFFAMVLPICCVLDGAEKVAPTQFQLPDTYHHECWMNEWIHEKVGLDRPMVLLFFFSLLNNRPEIKMALIPHNPHLPVPHIPNFCLPPMPPTSSSFLPPPPPTPHHCRAISWESRVTHECWWWQHSRLKLPTPKFMFLHKPGPLYFEIRYIH